MLLNYAWFVLGTNFLYNKMRDAKNCVAQRNMSTPHSDRIVFEQCHNNSAAVTAQAWLALD
jgi:hypothetical protein